MPLTFDCASWGYHLCRNLSIPKRTSKLNTFFEKKKHTILLTHVIVKFTCKANIRDNWHFVRHIKREMSRFCKFFLDYGGKLKAAITSLKFCRLSLMQRVLEIPVELVITHSDTSSQAFHIMKIFIELVISQPDTSSHLFHIMKDFIEKYYMN